MKQLVSLFIKFLPANQQDSAARWASILFAAYEIRMFFSDKLSVEMVVYLMFVFFTIALPGTLYYRIAAKFSPQTHWHFYIPLYNYYLLCRCAALPIGYTVLLVLPIIVQVIDMTGPQIFYNPENMQTISDETLGMLGMILLMISLIQLISIMNLWGRIAERLGKSYWKYGLLTPFTMYIPIFFLAFDSSKPVAYHSKKNHFLSFTQGEYAGEFLELPSDGFMMGRDSASVQLVFNDPDVSRVHLRISAASQGYEVEDMNTIHGTFIQTTDGSWQPLPRKQRLLSGLKIKFGSNILEVQ